jgi:hypothetical protein
MIGCALASLKLSGKLATLVLFLGISMFHSILLPYPLQAGPGVELTPSIGQFEGIRKKFLGVFVLFCFFVLGEG